MLRYYCYAAVSLPLEAMIFDAALLSPLASCHAAFRAAAMPYKP